MLPIRASHRSVQLGSAGGEGNVGEHQLLIAPVSGVRETEQETAVTK